MPVEIVNCQDRLDVPEGTIRSVLAELMQKEFGREVDISLAVVTDEKIAELNESYLHHEGATDVLAFPLDSDDVTGGCRGAFGEIVVSADHALAEAAKRGIDPQTELLLYVVHGMLHLAGYDDQTEAEAQEMRRREAEMLRTPPSNRGSD